MPKIVIVNTGEDGKSHIEDFDLPLQPFLDTEGAHGEGTPLQKTNGITFRVASPGYVLEWHCAPRRQYTITLAGEAEIEVGGRHSEAGRPGRCAIGRGPYWTGTHHPGSG